MGLLQSASRLFHFLSAGDKATSERTPQSFADFLVFEIVSNRFGLNLDDLAVDVPPEVRDSVGVWILFYLCWLYQRLVLEEHGAPFRDEMLDLMRERLMRGNALEAGLGDDLVGAIDACFGALDRATSMIGTKVQDIDVPFEVFAAMALLVADGGSPYYGQESLPNRIEFDVGHVLASAMEARRDYLYAATHVSPGSDAE
jgi:hypothetical protein